VSEPIDAAPIRSFIETFLRPHGIDKPVAPQLADTLIAHAGAAEAMEAPSGPEASFDPQPVSSADKGVVPLAHTRGKILIHPTPEAMHYAREEGIWLDRATVKWLKTWVKIGDVVYDVNAGFGPYALVAARQRGAVVVAFEPGYKAYAALCDNVLLNFCQGSVIPLPMALGDRDALANIKYERRRPGADRHSVQRTRWRMRPADSVQPNVHSVCVTRLDTAVNQYALPPPNHIRLSRTASVAEVLKGGRHTLALESLRSVWLDIAPEEEQTLITGLATFGLVVAQRRARRNAVQMVFSREALARTADPAGQAEEIPTS
jgi:FkbM family methyltransferase